jgi:hypothetical protein
MQALRTKYRTTVIMLQTYADLLRERLHRQLPMTVDGLRALTRLQEHAFTAKCLRGQMQRGW